MGGFRRTAAENSRLGAWPRGVPRLSISGSYSTTSCTGVSGLLMVASLCPGNQGGYHRLHDKGNHSVSWRPVILVTGPLAIIILLYQLLRFSRTPRWKWVCFRFPRLCHSPQDSLPVALKRCVCSTHLSFIGRTAAGLSLASNPSLGHFENRAHDSDHFMVQL